MKLILLYLSIKLFQYKIHDSKTRLNRAYEFFLHLDLSIDFSLSIDAIGHCVLIHQFNLSKKIIINLY